MTDDTKIEFYLENRLLIEQWAALRGQAASALDTALWSAGHQLELWEPGPAPRLEDESGWRSIRLDFVDSVNLGLSWKRSELLKGADGWPSLVVGVYPRAAHLRDPIKKATAGKAEAVGFTATGKDWLRYGRIKPESEPIEIETYAGHCVERLRVAWLELHELIEAATAGYAPGD